MPYTESSDKMSWQAEDRSTPGVDVIQLVSGMESDTVDLPVYAKALRIFVPSTGSGVRLLVTPVGAATDAATVPISVPPGAFSYEAIAVRRIWATGSVNLYAAGVEILLIRS